MNFKNFAFYLGLVGYFLMISAPQRVLAQSISFEVRPARILGLWRFTQSISETGQRNSKILFDLFSQSHYSKEKSTQKLISQFSQIMKTNFQAAYSFPNYPTSRAEMGWGINQHFEFQASQSNDLAEFKSRTAGTIAPADQQRLFEILEKVAKIYDDLIWNPNLTKLVEYGSNLKSNWEKGKLSSLFSKTGKFYGSVWPDKHQFMVHMVPVPAEKGNTSATVQDNAIILECLLGEKDISGTVGVIFHEMAHSAFESQPLEFQIELDSWFKNHTSKYRTLAQNLLNEGLATALGNGLAYREINGKEDGHSWYNDKEIDLGAKANSELVRKYIRKEKKIDKSFVNEWVKTYEKTFPDAPRDTAIRLGEIFLFIDGSEYKWQEVKPDVKNSFKPFSMWAYQPINTPDGLASFNSEIAHKPLGPALVYIVSNIASKEHLKLHVDKIPELKPSLLKFNEKLASSNFSNKAFSVLDYEEGRLIYIIWAPTADKLREQLKALKQIAIASETVTTIE